MTKPYTFHYKTNKPEKDGLFYERIFGPINSGFCACGNYRVIGDEKEDPKFCEQCGVGFVDSPEKRVESWNEVITRILGIPWGFLIGAEQTIVQSHISLVNKI